MVSVDEKPFQLLARKYPTEVDPRDGSVRYEYARNGTQALLAAFDLETGSVLDRVIPSRNGEALVAFIYLVWDNLNTHYDGKDTR